MIELAGTGKVRGWKGAGYEKGSEEVGRSRNDRFVSGTLPVQTCTL